MTNRATAALLLATAGIVGGCDAQVVNTAPLPDLAVTLSGRDLMSPADESMSLPPGDLAGVDLVQCESTCTTAGAVICDANQARTCVRVGSCLQYGPSTDCGSGLCCSGGCVPIDGNNCGVCNATCGGQIPACSAAAPYTCVCTGAACATLSEDCNPLSGLCQTCFPPPAVGHENRTDFWVDAASKVTPTGGEGCPYTSITAALNEANLSSAALKTIHVAPGTYSATATAPETLPLQLRNGVSLVGAGAGQTIISGTGAYDHSMLGGEFNATNYQATIVVGDPVKLATISNLTVVAAQSAQSSQSSVFAILCDEGNAVTPFASPPATPYPSPTLTVDAVTIGPGFGTGILATNTTAATGGCNLRLLRSVVTGNGYGAWIVGAGTGAPVPVPATVAAQIGDLAGNGNRFVSNTVGLDIWDNSSPVRVYGTTFDKDNWGTAIGQHPLYDARISAPDYLDFEGNTFSNLTAYGINAGPSPVIAQLLGNVFTNISGANVSGGTTPAYAIYFNSDGGSGSTSFRPEISRARNNQFIANDFALALLGAAVDGHDPFVTDFGNASDPGNNVFRCNATPTGWAMAGADVYIDVAGANGGSINLAGNAWDHATPSQAATLSNGTDVVVGASGPTLTLSGSTASTVACPVSNRPQ